ncbi:hypothetical protein RIR_jg29310.t1 [Rhizophagus irregularis DAOM 181602=DAOM 197198]|nr:hypothetical protein RIR_jg29310.t1 [Rhizophagus irregularis DAOM 181602=DAOM 197198]
MIIFILVKVTFIQTQLGHPTDNHILTITIKGEKKREIRNGLKYHPTDEKFNPIKATLIFLRPINKIMYSRITP